MDHKNATIKMLQEMQNEEYIKKIFCFVEIYYLAEQEEKRLGVNSPEFIQKHNEIMKDIESVKGRKNMHGR